METYTDNLQLCNKELNRKLHMLIGSLDEQTWIALRNKEKCLKASYELKRENYLYSSIKYPLNQAL